MMVGLMTLAQGALVEPMSVSFSGVLRSRLEPGQSALVLGAGPIGIGVLLGLRAIDVHDIVVVETAPARRAAVEALGVEHVIDPDVVDVATEVRRRTARRGVDAVIDCAGAAATFSIAPAVLRPRGRYVILAFGFIDVPFAPWLLARTEIELTGSCGYNSDVFTRVIDLIAGGAYPTDAWVEHVGLDDVTAVLAELRAGQRMRIGEQLLGLADRFDDVRALVEGHLLVGVSEGLFARLQVGIDHLEQGIATYEASPRTVERFETGNDPGVVCHLVEGMPASD